MISFSIGHLAVSVYTHMHYDYAYVIVSAAVRGQSAGLGGRRQSPDEALSRLLRDRRGADARARDDVTPGARRLH